MKSSPTSPPSSPPLVAFLRDSVAPLLLLCLVQTIFAGYTVLTEAALKSSLSAVVFAFVRDAVACLAFAPTLYLSEAPPACCRAAGAGADADAEDGDDAPPPPPPPAELWPRREHFAHFVALGLLGVWGGQQQAAESRLGCVSSSSSLSPSQMPRSAEGESSGRAGANSSLGPHPGCRPQSQECMFSAHVSIGAIRMFRGIA
jgi:hypothetical protein